MDSDILEVFLQDVGIGLLLEERATRSGYLDSRTAMTRFFSGSCTNAVGEWSKAHSEPLRVGLRQLRDGLSPRMAMSGSWSTIMVFSSMSYQQFCWFVSIDVVLKKQTAPTNSVLSPSRYGL